MPREPGSTDGGLEVAGGRGQGTRSAWTGNVDFGDLAVGDRWADLAIASLSLDWNFGEGHQAALFDAYGIDPDEERIRYYRALWDLES